LRRPARRRGVAATATTTTAASPAAAKPASGATVVAPIEAATASAAAATPAATGDRAWAGRGGSWVRRAGPGSAGNGGRPRLSGLDLRIDHSGI